MTFDTPLIKNFRKNLDRLRISKTFYMSLVVGKEGLDQIALLVTIKGNLLTAL